MSYATQPTSNLPAKKNKKWPPWPCVVFPGSRCSRHIGGGGCEHRACGWQGSGIGPGILLETRFFCGFAHPNTWEKAINHKLFQRPFYFPRLQTLSQPQNNIYRLSVSFCWVGPAPHDASLQSNLRQKVSHPTNWTTFRQKNCDLIEGNFVEFFKFSCPEEKMRICSIFLVTKNGFQKLPMIHLVILGLPQSQSQQFCMVGFAYYIGFMDFPCFWLEVKWVKKKTKTHQIILGKRPWK